MNLLPTPLFTLLASVLLASSAFGFSGCESQNSGQPTLEYKAGQMIKAGFRGMSVDESDHIERDLVNYHLGSVVLFDYDVPRARAHRNIESPEQLARLIGELNELAGSPLLITIDQEGGRVSRLKPQYGFLPSVSAGYLGKTGDPDSTRFHAARTAETLASLGINVNLSPVVDLNLNRDNPIIGGIERSFSSDPDSVVLHASITVQEHRKRGILTTLKHFPGHGSSREDSHLGWVDVTDEWTTIELEPWRKLIERDEADLVMTAHIFNEQWDPDHPATLSSAVLTGILREELGYEGVILSDDMQMEAVRSHYGLERAVELAVKAGVDILGFANNSVYEPDIVPRVHSILIDLVRSGRIPESRIDESWQRIKTLKQNLQQ
ncbi:MAG: glycoside hydrolase family 3 N-terminal domain-containing protein [Balneolaceae bacterium]